MVLLPKQWKSRSSPGFEAGADRENPFTISNKAAAGPPSGGFVVSGEGRTKLQLRKAKGRPDRREAGG